MTCHIWNDASIYSSQDWQFVMFLTESGYQVKIIPHIKIFEQSFKWIAATSVLFQPTFRKKEYQQKNKLINDPTSNSHDNRVFTNLWRIREEKKSQSFSFTLEKGSNWTYIRRSENVLDIFLRDDWFSTHAYQAKKC